MSGDCAATILRAKGRRLAKLIRADGSFVEYDDAKHFDADEVVVRDLDHLGELLRWLAPRPDRCLLRGSSVHGPTARGIRRLLHRDPKTGDEPTFYEPPRRWVAVDVDGLERPPSIPAADVAGCAAAAVGILPREFHGRRCVAAATSGHGIKPGIRMRLWFWLDGAASGPTLRRWFLDTPGIDLAVFSAAQCIYTATPALAPGAVDPIPERLVVLPGEPYVPIRPLPPPPAPVVRPMPVLRPGDPRADRYRDAALRGIAARLASTGEGNRHGRLVAEGCALLRLVGEGRISAAYAQGFLHDAAAHLSRKGQRQIPPEEVDELLGWAGERATT